MNEIGRRTKIGGIAVFVVIPTILTVYFILAHLNMFNFGGNLNQTVAFMDGWFHYFKLYAADIGCVGFMMIKYKWGIGKEKWFAAALPLVYGGATQAGVTTMDLYAKAIDLYNQNLGKTAAAGEAIANLGITADPRMQGFVAVLAIAVNVICIAEIIKRSVKLGKNPYANEVFVDTRDFQLAMDRAKKV